MNQSDNNNLSHDIQDIENKPPVIITDENISQVGLSYSRKIFFEVINYFDHKFFVRFFLVD